MATWVSIYFGYVNIMNTFGSKMVLTVFIRLPGTDESLVEAFCEIFVRLDSGL